jgi:hypothetical protein
MLGKTRERDMRKPYQLGEEITIAEIGAVAARLGARVARDASPRQLLTRLVQQFGQLRFEYEVCAGRGLGLELKATRC